MIDAVWLLLILVAAYLPYKGKNFVGLTWKKAMLGSGWFLGWSVALLFLAKRNLLIDFSFSSIALFVFASCLWFLSPLFIRKIGKEPKEYIEKNPIRFLVRFESPIMLLKFFEILFQQSIFLYILFTLLQSITQFEKLLWFMVIIALIHAGNFFFMPFKWSLFYFILIIPMAIVFGIMISQGQILVTTAFHLIFYLLFNVGYWFPRRVKSY